MSQTSKDNLLNLINFLGRFKDLKRSGWLARKVSSPESDAEHSFSLAFQALLLTPSYLDRCRCIELALHAGRHGTLCHACGLRHIPLPQFHFREPYAEPVKRLIHLVHLLQIVNGHAQSCGHVACGSAPYGLTLTHFPYSIASNACL